MTEQARRQAEAWSFFDNEGDIRDAASSDNERDGVEYVAKLQVLQSALDTPAGRTLLATLRSLAGVRGGFDPSLGFYDGAAYGFYRQGAHDVLQQLEIWQSGELIDEYRRTASRRNDERTRRERRLAGLDPDGGADE